MCKLLNVVLARDSVNKTCLIPIVKGYAAYKMKHWGPGAIA